MGMKAIVIDRMNKEFGLPVRETLKVKAWNLSSDTGVVVQTDQPSGEDAAFIWVPYPGDSATVPEIALQYPAESGRHSNTYASPGLGRGKPALKCIVRTKGELDGLISYIQAMLRGGTLPEVRVEDVISVPENTAKEFSASCSGEFIDIKSMPKPEPVRPRREAIPRAVQREVWQRDGGRCVECSTKEKLCFDHIVPFSRGGSNSVRNLQLLCERCNLSKSNRI